MKMTPLAQPAHPSTAQGRIPRCRPACAAETKSLALRFTSSANENVDFYAGEKPGSPSAATRNLAEAVPPAWQVVQVDLWEAFGRKPARIQAMSLMCSGGPAWFDQIRLSQTPEPPAEP